MRTTGLGLRGLWQDVRYSLRMLRRSPGFSLVAVAILSLGIGASTAAFSIVDRVFFRTIAVPEPERVVYVYSLTERGQRYPRYGENFANSFADRFDKIFSGITAHQRRTVTLGVDDQSAQARGELVTANYFDVLQVKPAIGRGFEPAEDDPANTSLAAVISDSLWTQRFKRDPNILRRQLRLDDKLYAVVGVTPPGFEGLSDIWSPSQFWVTVVQFDPSQSVVAHPGSSLGTVARLRPGVTLRQVQAVIDVVGPQLQQEAMRSLPARMWRPARQVVVPSTDVSDPGMPDTPVIAPQILSGLIVVVGIVLVIAVTNISGVLAARSVTRTQEVAVRRALGAGAWQLLRQLVTESVLLALAGGAFGFLVAWILTQAYYAVSPARFAVEGAFNLRVVMFTMGACLAVGSLVGIVPALQSGRVNVVAALASGGGSGRTGRTRSRLRHAIVIPQIALSIVLLVVAGVHLRALSTYETADLGYAVENVITVRANHWDVPRPMSDRTPDAREVRGERDRAYARSLEDKLRTVKGASGVAITSSLPVWGPSGVQGRFVSQAAFVAGAPNIASADTSYVSPGFFDTMGIRIIEGRDFDSRDAMTTPAVAIVSENVARRLWPGRSPIGESLAWYLPERKEQPWWLRVVGVVSETDPVQAPGGDRPMIYTALSQTWLPYAFVVVARHREGDAVPTIEQLQRAIASADTFSEIREVRSMSMVIDELLFPRRAAVGVLMAGGGAGLLLACIGIYGVISHSIEQRLQEIGIRATLGADRRQIIALVLREALTVSLAGAVPGVGFALLALRLTTTAVAPVPIFDLATFAIVPLATLLVILAASYLPARRASRLDPMTVLRGL